MPPIKIIIDHREPESMVARLQALQYTIEIQQLRTGDYLMADQLLFERKTLSDFATSIIDGRLFYQAKRLACSHKIPIFLLEGGAETIKKSNIRREAIQGAIIYLSVILGIPILRSYSQAESVQLMGYTCEQWQRTNSQRVVRHGFRPKSDNRRKNFILQGFPNIGSKRALNLLKAMGSIQNIVNAEVDALANIEGIGVKTAKNFLKLCG